MSRRQLLVVLGSGLLVGLGLLYWFGYVPVDTPRPEEPLPEETVTLYFLDEREYRLRPVEREVDEAGDRSERVEQILRELVKDPEDTGLVRLLPEEAELRSSYLEGQIVYLDFNDGLVGAAQGSSGEMMLLYSVVNSVLDNVSDEYKLVQFLIEGETRKTIGPYGEESGHIAVSYPLGPRWNLADDTSP